MTSAQEKTKFENDMNDHLSLAKTLAHHDAAIFGLGTRMTGVEAGLSHVNEKVSTLDSRVAQGFGEVLSQIRESKAAQGPGFSDSIKLSVGIVSLGAAAIAAVTFLVASFVEPKIEKINASTDVLSSLRTRDEIERAREYEKLRDGRYQQYDNAIEKLSNRVNDLDAKAGWNSVTVEGVRK